MDFVVNGIIDFSNIDNINVIYNIDVFDLVDVYRNIFVNNTTNNVLTTFDISNIDINLKDLNIKKLSNNNEFIYCINFTYTICINLVINNQLQQFKVTNICSKSFMHKDLDENYFDLYPINLDVINLDNKLGFCINFILVSKVKTNSNNLLLSNIINNNKTPIDNDTNFISKDFAYIDVSEEFI